MFVSEVDKVCTAGGGQCGTTTFYCDTTQGSLKCKCGKQYNAGTAGDTTCTAKSKHLRKDFNSE